MCAGSFWKRMVSLHTQFPKVRPPYLFVPGGTYRCLQPNVSTETAGEESSSSHTLQIHINEWFCSATPRATLGRARVIITGGKKIQVGERRGKGEMKKTGALFVFELQSTLLIVHSVALLCLLTPVSKQIWRLNSWSMTYGVGVGPEQLPGLSAVC